jgi:hypothetical protein
MQTKNTPEQISRMKKKHRFKPDLQEEKRETKQTMEKMNLSFCPFSF